MPAMRRVAMLIDTSRAYGRGLARGVAAYNQEHRRWSIRFKPLRLDDPPPPWLSHWQGDGILAQIGNRRTARAILQTGVPAVDLEGAVIDLELPFIGVDHRAVAQLVLEHLMERGFRQFGFYGLRRGTHPQMDDRCDCFEQLIAEAGFSCSVFKTQRGRRTGDAWKREQDRIAQWIGSLPKPVGVMACNNDCALELLDSCRRAGVMAPDELAVVGVDNDKYMCDLSIPPLTVVNTTTPRIAYEAAALLDRMMNGKAAPKRQTRIAPLDITVRGSTDVLATEEQDVVRAVAFIRAHACERIRAADVLRHVGRSRTSLEPQLKRVLGRTIHQEIQHVQTRRAKELLLTTDLSIKQVAVQSGFNSVHYMTRVFRQTFGQPPVRYRNQMRMKVLGSPSWRELGRGL